MNLTLSRGALVAATLAAAAQLAAQDLVVRARTIALAPDAIVESSRILVRDGKVALVGDEIPNEVEQRARVIDFGDAFLVPGFVLAHSTLGQEQDLAERAVALTPDLVAKDGFDPFGDALKALPKHAVTSAALAPASTNVAGGIASLVEPGETHGHVRQDALYAKFALVQNARNPERPPTSLIGAVDLVRQAFADAKNGALPGPDGQALLAVARGERRAFVHADQRAEILAALALCRDLGIAPVVCGGAEAGDCLVELQRARASLVLAPLRPELRTAQLELPAQLERSGLSFCFAGLPSTLRTSAALAVQNGASKKAALAALTRTPAELCGIATTHGSLRRGCDADFAVFSGDPIDLTSRQLAVFGDGILLHGALPKAATKTTSKPVATTKETL